MKEKLDMKDVENFYALLGIDVESNIDENMFFNSNKKDEHLVWKPLNI